MVFSFATLSCEEALPPRNEPRTFLVSTIELNPGPVVLQDSSETAREGSFILALRNIFDEVLQDSARVKATIEIWLKDDPSQRRVLVLDENDLSNVVVRFGIATLGVDSAARFARAWNHRTDNGTLFWRFSRHLYLRYSHAGTPYCETDPMQFLATASIQLFKNVQPVKTRTFEFSLTYWVFYANCTLATSLRNPEPSAHMNGNNPAPTVN